MIVPDVNLLVYAYNDEDLNCEEARRWSMGLINGVETVGESWSDSYTGKVSGLLRHLPPQNLQLHQQLRDVHP